MSLTSAKMPRLSDKLEAQEADAKAALEAAAAELEAVSKAKGRAKKKN